MPRLEIRLSEAQKVAWARAAASCGKELSAWMRECLDQRAGSSFSPPPRQPAVSEPEPISPERAKRLETLERLRAEMHQTMQARAPGSSAPPSASPNRPGALPIPSPGHMWCRSRKHQILLEAQMCVQCEG